MSSFLTIHKEEVPVMESPVAHLFEHVHKPLAVMSRAMREKLIGTGLKLTLRYEESTKFKCGYDHKTGEIVFSTRFVEVVWVTSYLNAIYFHLVRERGGLLRAVAIDPLQEPVLCAAMKLFGWMLNAWQDTEACQNLPEELPRPDEHAAKDSWENLADELTLVAIGYILLHEVAHVYLLHVPSKEGWWSIEQEKDADRQAVEWYFADYPDSHSNDRIKRDLGVASALIAQVATGMFLKDFGGKSHPPSWQRLDQVLRLIESDCVHPLFAFASQLLPLYRSMSGGTFAKGASADCLAAFDKFIDELSQTVSPEA
jgi:hypothetical protein